MSKRVKNLRGVVVYAQHNAVIFGHKRKKVVEIPLPLGRHDLSAFNELNRIGFDYFTFDNMIVIDRDGLAAKLPRGEFISEANPDFDPTSAHYQAEYLRRQVETYARNAERAERIAKRALRQAQKAGVEPALAPEAVDEPEVVVDLPAEPDAPTEAPPDQLG